MALRRPMRCVIFIFGLTLLSGCASVNGPASSSSKITSGGPGLPTSALKPGQCGLFGWSTDASRQFIFYADDSTARYSDGSAPIDLVAQSVFPSTEYTDPQGKPVTLRLGAGEDMLGGLRYPSARIVSLNEEGWERLQPVAIVKTCQPK
jgi:hypothetical protein